MAGETPLAPTPIRSLPGIKRDGTRFEGDNYVDGLWCRFVRGLPRKIGGYRSINKYLSGLPRSLHGYTRNLLTYIHAGSAAKLERLYIDGSLNTSVIYDRTPSTLTADDLNMWQFDVDHDTSGDLQLMAQVAPNLECICNSNGGQIFYGDLFGTGVLVEVPAINLPATYSATGGIVSLHPYTVVYGSDGFVMWSVPTDCTDFINTGAGSAYVTGQKILKGLPLRGGPGSSPSGLLWSADSLIRMTWVGGTEIFQFDTISAQTSMMSSSCVIEYDGVYYWVGTDRFLMFNGVVREVENNLNRDFFFDNINMSYRQKVHVFKVPRYGEIWWCFPKGDSTEPNWAVIYNVRENTWYDTELPNSGRGAAIPPAIFRLPIATGVTDDGAGYKLWVHERGTDEIDGTTINPIRSYFETADIALPVQAQVNRATQVLYIEPDFVQVGDMTVAVHGRANARAPEVDGTAMAFPDTATSAQEQVVFLKEQRRELRFRFESNCIDGNYQMGLPLAHLRPGDGTTLS